MEERKLSTLEYIIDKRIKELQKLMCGKEEDEADYIKAATEEQTLLKIRDALKEN